jgi:hypothetical protein
MFSAGLITNLAGIVKVLGMLPIPIEVKIEPGGGDEIADLVRAQKLLQEIPMHDILRAACNTAILDWMTGVTLGSFADRLSEDDEDWDWMVASGIIQMHRCRDEIELALGILSGKVEIEEE